MRYNFLSTSLLFLSFGLLAAEGINSEKPKMPITITSALPTIEEDKGFSYSIGFTYQSVLLANMNYVYSTFRTSEGDGVGTALQNKPVKNYEIDFSLGFREPKGSYDVKISNQYFQGSSQSSFSGLSSGSSYFLGTGASNIDNHSYLSAKYNLLGIELAENFSFCSRFNLRWMIGLLNSLFWVEQKNFRTVTLQQAPLNYKFSQSSLGPQAGFTTSWLFKKNFSLFLNTKTALMYGVYRTKTNADLSGPVVSMKGHLKSIFPYLESLLGLSYSFYLKDNRDFIKLQLGYDVKCFLGMNQTQSGDPYSNYNSAFYSPLFSQGLLFDFACSF